VGRWLDSQFGPDRVPDQIPVAPQPAMAGRSPATE
jgi:hypothetical protein